MDTKRKASIRRLPHGGARLGVRLPLLRRRRWRNHTGNQAVDPVAIVEARSPEDLAEAVAEARRKGLTVRMIGSGHSWSDVALTTGYMIPADGFVGVELFPAGLRRSGDREAPLVSVGSGTTIKAVNDWLERNGLALIQMGGYDGQTLAGVVSTSTHGSGLRFKPFPDYIRSIDLVDGTGKFRRVEPADGPTDARAFRGEQRAWELTQEDGWFDAVVCGMGCMGMIVSLAIEVRESFRLTEVRTVTDWNTVRAQLLAGEPRKHEHYEVYINPYPRDGPGSNRCIVTIRTEGSTADAAARRPWLPELMGHLPWITLGVMQLFEKLAPGKIPGLLDTSLKLIRCPKGYTNASYLVFNIGSTNNLRAYSGEMGVPTADNQHVAAVERMIEIAELYRRDGTIFHTSPVSLRFVAPSRALMSMMHDRETMMMELIQLVDTDGGQEVIAAHEEALAEFGVRPHWGQINTLAGSAEIAKRYGGLSAWESVRAQLDPHGVFASPFSRRVGITSEGVSSS
jgi:FAD/FMN-containing dehydrogenase